MYTQTQIEGKIQEFLTYSQTRNPTYSAKYASLCNAFLADVTAYYNVDRSNLPMRELRYGMYTDLLERGTVRKPDGFDRQLKTNYPTGYADLSAIFYDFPLMEVSDETFYNAWVVETVTTGSGTSATSTTTVTRNTLLDTWSSQLSSAPSNELSRANTLSEWLKDSTGYREPINFWEQTGEVTYAPETEDIANDMFINRKWKEVIQTLSLTEYIPSYV